MKTHLKIIYGCDDRYNIVKDTIPVCRDYFDTITIYNCGNRESTDKFTNLPANCRIEYFDHFFGDMESILRGMMKPIPENDWFVWLDADERPSPMFLRNLKQDVVFLEEHNYNFCRFPSLAHQDGMTWATLYDFPQTVEAYRCSQTYAAMKFIKKDKLFLRSNFGAHYDYYSANGNRDYYFPHPICHIKASNQVPQSCALKSYTIDTNDCRLTQYKELLASDEHKRLREFQRETGIKTSPELFRKVNIEKDPVFIKKYTKLMESYVDSKLYTFKEMSGLVKHGMNFDTVVFRCGRECCNYGDVQL